MRSLALGIALWRLRRCRRKRKEEAAATNEQVRTVSETVALIYQQTSGGPARQGSTSDSLDSKAFQSFSAASVVLGFGSFTSGHLGAAPAALYIAAGFAYLLAGWFTYHIVRARNFRVTDAADRWWPSHGEATADYVQRQMLDDLADAAAVNRGILREKGERIKWLLLSVGAEVILVALAVIVARS